MKIIICFLLTFSSYALQEGESSFEYTQRVNKELTLIKELGPEKYTGEIDQYRVNLEKYIDHKKRVCEGEFSTIILTQKGTEGARGRSNKLTKDERKLCFRELKALQITFVNNMYVARKKYLEFIHNKRVAQLKEARDNSIRSINKSFSRKRNAIRR